MIKHKFKAKSCQHNDIKFGSKLERSYYLKLNALKLSGDILFFLRQVPIDLPANIIYRIDFVEFWADGSVQFTEVKGYDTPMGKLKIKQAEAILGIEIKIVRK